MNDPWEILKLLGDTTRLRLLHLLRAEELSVHELQEILDMGQSRISSHLALLRKAGLVADRRDGKRTYYTLRMPAPVQGGELLEEACALVAPRPEIQSDRRRLQRILDRRRRAAERYFNAVAGRLGRKYCPGRSWEAFAQLLLELIPPLDVVDLGCGEGSMVQLMARRARSVVGVDNAPNMVEVGERLARENGLENLRYVEGDIEEVPLPDKSFDLALLSQALHHATRPHRALEEAHRLLRPGGRLLLMDLREHTFEKARELYADLWLGFSEDFLHEALEKAGFQRVEVRSVSREVEEPHFETLLASGYKTGGREPVTNPS